MFNRGVQRSGWRLGLFVAVVFLVAGSESLSEPPRAASASTVSFVGRLASAKSSTTSTAASVAAVRAVPAGHALLLAVMLNGTASGVFSAHDPAGNVYTVDVDQLDGSGDRLVVLSALNVKALPSGATITLAFPTAAASYVTVDEFAGVAALDRGTSATGTTKVFNSGAATTTAAGELLFGVEGQTAAGGSTWGSGWTALTSLAGGGRRLSPAYEIAGAAGPYSATGSASGTWLTALAAYTAVPPPENPPVAALTVNPSSGVVPLTVTADASASTDVDNTPIASYTFDFGDGSGSAVVGPQAGATATHTYNTTGTFTVTVTVTDTGGLASTKSSTVTVVADAPPTSKLTVTPSSGAAPLAVTADASASTDTDATKISSYTFDFGDGSGSAVVGPQAGATATHTYANTGTFTARVTVTDSAGLSSTASATVTVTFTSSPAIGVFAGYYDTHHDDSHLQPKPNPWQGSANVVFVGKPDSPSGGWDTSAVRIDNVGSGSISGVAVTVDIGSNHYALWASQSVPAGQKLILAQTALENFDGSDTSPAGCYGCDPSLCITAVVKTVPVIHVTLNGVTTNYQDTGQILNTQGADKAGCPDTGGTRNDESEVWQQIG